MDDIIGSDGLDSLLPSAWRGMYEVLAILKNSPHRTTALVKRKSDGAKLVLKRSDSEQEDLSYELSILREVGGCGIPECLDFVSEDGVGYILREYIEGQTLLDYIQKRGALSKDETLSIMIPLCRIVKRLHSQTPPVIHRDIKAENIIRSSDGSVYLIDFGIARRYDEGSGQDTQVLGTPQYSPPEQYGYRQTDTRSDVYTMGALMHELLTGESALDKGTADSGLLKITDKCTRFDPDDRYRDAGALLCALERASAPASKRAAVIAIFAAAVAIIIAAIFAARVSFGHGGAGTESDSASQSASSDAAATSAPSADTSESTSADTSAETSAPETSDVTVPAAPAGTDIYAFKSPAIEAEVCASLGIEPGHVTYDDLARVTSIMLVGNVRVSEWPSISIYGSAISVGGAFVSERGSVDTVEDIAQMPNLTTLALCNQNITDLSPLRNCRIQYLSLHGNNISDLSPLADMARESLLEVAVSNNPISDITPLCGGRIYNLNVGATNITDLNALKNMMYLSLLNAQSCLSLGDISALTEAKSLRYLFLGCLPAGFESVLRQITWIEDLYIYSFDSTLSGGGFSFIGEGSGLRRLFIDVDGTTTLDGIENALHLNDLHIVADVALDISPLANLNELYSVDLTGMNAVDYSPLGNIPSLGQVLCTAAQEADVRAACGDGVNIIVSG